MSVTYKFKTTINCGGCLASVKPVFENNQLIEKWDVELDNPDKVLTVTMNVDEPELIITQVQSKGFSIERIAS